MTRRLLGAFIVRGTEKFLDRVGKPDLAEGELSTTALGDWFGTVRFWKPQVALFVNERTRFSLLVPLAPAATVLDGSAAGLVDGGYDTHAASSV